MNKTRGLVVGTSKGGRPSQADRPTRLVSKANSCTANIFFVAATNRIAICNKQDRQYALLIRLFNEIVNKQRGGGE